MRRIFALAFGLALLVVLAAVSMKALSISVLSVRNAGGKDAIFEVSAGNRRIFEGVVVPGDKKFRLFLGNREGDVAVQYKCDGMDVVKSSNGYVSSGMNVAVKVQGFSCIEAKISLRQIF